MEAAGRIAKAIMKELCRSLGCAASSRFVTTRTSI